MILIYPIFILIMYSPIEFPEMRHVFLAVLVKIIAIFVTHSDLIVVILYAFLCELSIIF
jgi:hypothetical protein